MDEVFEISFSICSISHRFVEDFTQDGSDLCFSHTRVIARFQTGLEPKQRATRNKVSVEKLLLLEKSQLSGCAQKEECECDSFEFSEGGSDEWVFDEDSLYRNENSHPNYNSETVHVIIDKYVGSTENSPRN